MLCTNGLRVPMRYFQNPIGERAAGKSGVNPAQCRYCDGLRGNGAFNPKPEYCRVREKQAATGHGKGFGIARGIGALRVPTTIMVAAPIGAAFFVPFPAVWWLMRRQARRHASLRQQRELHVSRLRHQRSGQAREGHESQDASATRFWCRPDGCRYGVGRYLVVEVHHRGL